MMERELCCPQEKAKPEKPAALTGVEGGRPGTVLFAENLPPEVTEVMLTMLFRQSAGFEAAPFPASSFAKTCFFCLGSLTPALATGVCDASLRKTTALPQKRPEVPRLRGGAPHCGASRRLRAVQGACAGGAGHGWPAGPQGALFLSCRKK